MFLVQNPPSAPSTPREQFVSEVGHSHRFKLNLEGSIKLLNRL